MNAPLSFSATDLSTTPTAQVYQLLNTQLQGLSSTVAAVGHLANLFA